MSFPGTDLMGLKKYGLVDVCYRGYKFLICKIAKWAYMAVVVVEDTTEDEYRDSRVTLACWHIDDELGKKIIENNALFESALANKQTGRAPDLIVTVTNNENPLEDILREVESGVRKPIESPGLDRIFKERRTEELKKIVDRYGDAPQFSDKKVWPGMLMLLIYPLGLPFFYFNMPVLGIIMLVVFILSLVLPALLIPTGLLGCVFIVMTLVKVLTNKAKDKQGRLICTAKDKKFILDSIEEYKRNVIELQINK